ncbi:MAG: rRNA pseudouridine synthase [Acidobacteria bacterium]|nr:MAG: rRNA pseudouridine synthase [Acidobacteriota bacterium]
MRPSVPIDRAMSKLGLASRAEARALIHAGKVRVNGKVVREVKERIKLNSRIQISDAPAHPAPAHLRTGAPAHQRVIIAFNKPRGVVTTTKDPEGRPTVFGVLAERGMTDRLLAIGRLDMASTGLLLLTNDNELLNSLTDPVNGVERKYAVTVRGRVSPEAAAALPAARVELRKASGPESHLLVTLTQGKNREIRNMFEEIGHEVTRLHRVEFGPISLGKLQPGDWIDVTERFP